ncbi:MAG: dihydrolipoyl dehydrogenase [Pleomorphochaeta sp.]
MNINMSVIPGGKTGKVGKISIKKGDKISKGDILAQVETGKGNKSIKATESGLISKILIDEGDEISSKQLMFEYEAIEDNSKINNDNQIESQVKEKTIKKIESELLIIGSGPGGYVAAIYAAKNGMKVTIVEKENLGGTCLNVGCIPTKALVKSSEVCHTLKNSKLFGIENCNDVIVNMKQVISQKQKVVNKLVSGVDFLMQKNNIQVLKGVASFVSENQVSIKGKDEYLINAKNIIIATGSKISKINIPGLDLPFVMDSTSALTSTDLPKSITIIGGGVIGMEFAFIYKNLGVEVNVVEFMDRLLTMVDKEISNEIKRIAIDEGINIYTSSKVKKIQKSNTNQAIITFESQDGEHLLVSDKVLSAIGREPNLESLMIENSKVKLNENKRGIAVDLNMRTNVENIYAIGDVTNIIQLAHVASHQGIVAVSNIINESKKMDYKAVPNVIFTKPEIASVGLNEDECKEKDINYKVSKFNFMSNGKALTMNETEGYIKLIKDNDSNKIIGGTIIGAEASSLISTITLAISKGLNDHEIKETIFAHPTTSEVIHEAALGLSIGALHE